MTPHYGRRLFLIISASTATFALACASGNGAVGPSGGTPANIVKVSGDNQAAVWGSTIPAPLVVKVVDSAGAPVTDATVSWLTSFDDAPQVQSLTTTNKSGQTQVDLAIAGSPGPYAVAAAINGHSVTFNGSANVNLAPGYPTFSSDLFSTCGLTTKGTAFCWGAGSFGQLGGGDTDAHAGPIPVVGGHSFTQIFAGTWMNCGTVSGGALYCWGQPGYTGLGNGAAPPTGTTISTPTAAGNGRSFTQVSLQDAQACGMSGGAAYCWGHNTQGGVGDGTNTDRWAPVPVATPHGVTFTYVGVGFNFSCALATTGAVYCWGSNTYGTLGTGSTAPDSSLVPVLVTGGQTFTTLRVGSVGVCGLTAAGTVYCWGEEVNGNGTSTMQTVPTAISQTGLTFTQLSLVGPMACALTASGAAYCWGQNYYGSLGSGSFSSSGLMPTPVTGGLTFSYIGSGGVMACGITTTSAVYCWGANTAHQLGLPFTADTMYATPQLIPGMGGT